MLTVCAATLVLAAPAFAQTTQSVSDKVEAAPGTTTPTVTMKTWKMSSEAERYSFLAGFVTMLELEREWQGANAVPIKQSLIGSWSQGLSNVSIRTMDEDIEAYINSSDANMDRLVVDFLWFNYVQPTVTEKIGKAAY